MNDAASPNGIIGTDAMLSLIAGQIVSVMTNPDIYKGVSSWQDSNGDDIFQKCGNVCLNAKEADYSLYNVEWSNRRYLIQGNWQINDPQGCVIPENHAVKSSSSSTKSRVSSSSVLVTTSKSTSSISSISSSKSSTKSTTQFSTPIETPDVKTQSSVTPSASPSSTPKDFSSHIESSAENVSPLIAVITMLCAIAVVPMFWSG